MQMLKPTVPSARAEADRLIAETRLNSAEFPDVLANHLPMVLEALYRLGAPAQRLAEFADTYNRTNAVPRLPPATSPLTRDDWQTALGDRSREADYRRFFADEARRMGGRAAIRMYVPVLARGVAASALHGLMRTAYGVLRDDDAEIGTALGYWAATYLPLRDEPDGSPETDDPLDLALIMRSTPAFVQAASDLADTHHLWHWMRAIGGMDEFAPLMGRLSLGPDSLDRVAAVSLRLYAGTMTFEALHALTGSHWVRLVSQHMDDPLPLVRQFWQAILAVYPKIGMPAPASEDELADLRARVLPSVSDIAQAAVATDDEHDHSLVFSALQEYERTGDIAYRAVAAKRMGLTT